FRERRFVASLLQLELHDALLFTLRFHVTPLGLHRRFDRYWLNGAEKLPGDRGVDPYAAECEAPGQSERLVRTLTPIDGLSRRTARVTHHQVPPTATTGQQPSQQRASSAPRLYTSRFAIGVDRKLLLVAFELRPVDIAVVVILQQNLPFLKRLAVPVAFA